MRHPIFHASVYGIIKNKKWKILFFERWDKANWYNWRFQIPAWHIDWNEKISSALIREMKEELKIDVKEFNLVHTRYRIFEDWREYLDFYFEIINFEWNTQIWEPDKCSNILYKWLNELEDINLLFHDKLALDNIENDINFSELFLKDYEY